MPNRSPVLASAVQVRFPGRRCSGLVSDTVNSYYLKSINISSITLSIPNEPSYAGHPGLKLFNDTAPAQYTVGMSDPTNKTALDNLARRVAQDFYDYRSVSFDAVFNGVTAPLPNGLIDVIEWIYNDEDATTRVMSPPFNDGVEELCHMDSTNSDCKDVGMITIVEQVPCYESYGPPAVCSANASGGINPVISRYMRCLEDGRLKSTFIIKDRII